MKARVIKTNTNRNGRLASSGINSTFEIYKYQTDKINGLIESLFNRNKPIEEQSEQRDAANQGSNKKSDIAYNFTQNNDQRLSSSNQINSGLPGRHSSEVNDEYATYGVGESSNSVAQSKKQPLFEEKNDQPIIEKNAAESKKVPVEISKE